MTKRQLTLRLLALMAASSLLERIEIADGDLKETMADIAEAIAA